VHVLILGGSSSDRSRAAQSRVPSHHQVVIANSGTLPFAHAREECRPPPPRSVLIEAIERAFPNNQAGSTRLVLTQSTYLMQTWIDALDASDKIVATADRAALAQCAPEALQARGPWTQFDVVDLAERGRGDSGPGDSGSHDGAGRFAGSSKASPQSPVPGSVSERLAAAYAASDPAERLRICREVTEQAPDSAAAWVALASAYREHQDLRAREALERAAALAPDWEAVHYELGKLWLAFDDTARARDSFQRAADLMPTFSAAFSNLGATLGELGDPEAALTAFRQALAHDPRSHTILSNIGVVARELGGLDESETALRQVTAIAPEFVFGHYNLGHTLFLAGRYTDAIAAYEEGVRRDPQKTPRQTCRLAMARFAAGDVPGAEHDLWPAVNRAAPDDREDLLLEAFEIAHAVVSAHPGQPAQRAFADRLAAEITKSE
jgi:tetratricopeptide (TPR) repeat protein